MTRSIALAGSLLFLAASFVAAQDKKDGWKWDPSKKRIPAVGDRLFEEGVDTTDNVLTVQAPGKEQNTKTIRFTLAYRVVRECLALEGDKISKERIKVERWQRKPIEGAKDQEPADASLEGKTILIDGVGEKKIWKLEKEDPAVTENARVWIEKDLVKKEKGDKANVLDPGAPVAADTEWTVDPKLVARDMFDDVPIDAAQSSVKGKLSNVRVENGLHVGTVELKVRLALKLFPGCQFPWSEGGVLEVTLTGDNVLDQAKAGSGKLRMELVLKGKAVQETPGGGTARAGMDMHLLREGKTGDAGK